MKTGVAKRDKFQTEWEKKIFRGKRVKKAWEDQFRVRMARQYFEGQVKKFCIRMGQIIGRG